MASDSIFNPKFLQSMQNCIGRRSQNYLFYFRPFPTPVPFPTFPKSWKILYPKFTPLILIVQPYELSGMFFGHKSSSYMPAYPPWMKLTYHYDGFIFQLACSFLSANCSVSFAVLQVLLLQMYYIHILSIYIVYRLYIVQLYHIQIAII